MDNLKFKVNSFDLHRNAILVSETTRQEVLVSAAVLQKAFITRAWLDRTLVNCAVGKCHLEAEVVQRGQRLEATKVWLSLEKTNPNESKGQFKNFGLELSKPRLNGQKTGSKLFDIAEMDKPIRKLSERFSSASEDLYNFRFDNDFLIKLDERQRRNATALMPDLVETVFTPDWRMVTGMGEASVYETNMTLHHIYGVPYIPASSIKGVLRHYLKEEVGADKQTIELIFGEGDEDSSTKKPVRGQCTFFDAFPLKAPRIELDVMTPHYPDYYTGDKFPADWQSPNPIHFLTVGQGTPFRFLIGLPKLENADELKTKLSNWLSEALQSRGLGAKTAVGYGYWKSFSEK